MVTNRKMMIFGVLSLAAVIGLAQDAGAAVKRVDSQGNVYIDCIYYEHASIVLDLNSRGYDTHTEWYSINRRSCPERRARVYPIVRPVILYQHCPVPQYDPFYRQGY